MGGGGRRRPVGEGGRRSAGFAQPLAEKEDMQFHLDREDEGQMSSWLVNITGAVETQAVFSICVHCLLVRNP